MDIRSSRVMTEVLENQNVLTQDKDKSSAIYFPYITCIVLLSLLVARIWMKVETTRLGYRLGELREQNISLGLDRQELELQLSVVRKPKTLFNLASKRLGMVNPTHQQVVRIK